MTARRERSDDPARSTRRPTGRRLALVDEPRLRSAGRLSSSVYELAQACIAHRRSAGGAHGSSRRRRHRSTTTRSTPETRSGGCCRRSITRRAGALPRLRHRPHPLRQRQESPGDARQRGGRLTDSMRMFRSGRRRRPAAGGRDRRRARVVLQGHRHHAARPHEPLDVPATPRTAARSRRSPASTSSTPTARRGASAWHAGQRVLRPPLRDGGTTSIWPARSCARARSARSW